MAYTIYIMAILLAACVHGAQSVDDDDDDIFSNFPFPKLPNMPDFSKFHKMHFPKIPKPKILTPQEIMDKAVRPGENFSGISVSSSSSSVNKDGKVVNTGGTTVISNINGKVQELHFDNNNNPQTQSTVVTSSPDIIISELPGSVSIIQGPSRQSFMSYSSGPSNFIGSSSVSFSQASDINGKKVVSGQTNLITNVNGDVTQKVIRYGTDSNEDPITVTYL